MPMIRRGTSNGLHTGARRMDGYLLLALVLSLVAAAPLLAGPGIVNTRAGGDSPFLLQRVHQLTANLRQGVLLARWMPDAAYGLGYPAFNYYAALPYYVAALLNWAGVGLLWGIKLTQALGFLLAGGAMYALARALRVSRLGATLASATYTFAPFHLVNVYVRGDSLSEFYAMALYPLILWALIGLARSPSAPRMAALAGSYAALVLSHNISAMLFSPLLALWLGAKALERGRARGLCLLAWGAGAICLGLALSLWFWGPALRERSLVQLSEQTTGYFHFAGHFRSGDLIQASFLHDYVIDGDREPFGMGLAQAAIALAGLAGLLVQRLRRQRQDVSFYLAALTLVGYTWLITPSSRPVWDGLPLLAYAQFPWRLLSVQALAAALLAGQIPILLGKRLALPGTMACVLAVTLAGMLRIAPDRLPIRDGDVTAQRLMLYETYSGNIGSTVRYEYLPREMVPRPLASGVQLNGGIKPAPLALEGALLHAELRERGPISELWQVDVSDPALLAFHTTFFPGWRATVDGAPQAIEPLSGLGLIGVRLSPGSHVVSLHLGPTPIRRYATWASALGAMVWAGLVLIPALGAPRRRRQLAMVALALALGAMWLRYAPERSGQTSESGPLVMDFMRMPYLHRQPGGVLFGADQAEDRTKLIDYALAKEALAPGEVLTIDMRWADPDPSAQVTLELVAATAHYSGRHPIWASDTCAIDAREVSLNLPLPDEIPTGLYAIACRVELDGRALAPHSAPSREMDRLSLQPIQIVAHRQATGNETALGHYGPEFAPPVVALVGVTAKRASASALEVGLTWHSLRQAPLNYELSLRLNGADGERIASRDLSPLLGGYPTSLWRPGELVTDRVVLKVPAETVLSETDSLEIVLYDRLTLKSVGTTQVPLAEALP
ncbi:MAG: hypothetical protein JXA74_03685 [Anaerolineae bacterium]|nr:hypothetical protein [Anaerolineae bacterium]